MSSGGSIAAMNSTIKNNMKLLKGRGSFKRRSAMYQYYRTKINKSFAQDKLTPEARLLIKQKARIFVKKRQKRLLMIIGLGTFLALSIVTAIIILFLV